MLQTVMRCSIDEAAHHGTGVFDDVARAAVGADLADEKQNDVLGGDAAAKLPIDTQLEGFRSRLQQRLRGQHVLDFACADAEGQSAESAVRGGVAIAADDGHARLGEAKLGADDMHDALLRIGQVVHANAELAAIVPKRVDLLFGNGVGNRQPAIGRRNIMVGDGDRQFGPADLAACQPQTFKGLGAGDFVNQVQVDVQQRLLSGFGMHEVCIPDLFEHRAGVRGHRGLGPIGDGSGTRVCDTSFQCNVHY